ncbi:MAG: radical SAM protein [Candidatus Aminicenantes bacterium]|nr:radical SAM protein [Candidatus Aminicenantes bacterium]
MKKKYTAAGSLHFLQVGEDAYIGWNRFWPSIFILNEEALALLERIEQGQPIELNEEIEYYLKEFQQYRFIYAGAVDLSTENFAAMVRRKVEEPRLRAEKFYRDKEAYDELKIVNDECNLACSYCVNRHGRDVRKGINQKFCGGAGGGFSKEPPARRRQENKLKIALQCVDAYFARKIKNKSEQAKIFFNGGEILLEWQLIKEIVGHISKEYAVRGIEIQYEINTNLTLLTEEIAGFLKKHNFKVHISIDGYGAAHDRTRKYFNGRGSFADIIEKLKIYRKYHGEESLPTFQGTIENPELFDPGEVYKMEQYGFFQARLAPNLLGASEADARRKAALMGEFLELNSRQPFKVTEQLFTRLKNKINMEEYEFSFNCPGLCALPGLGIEINLSTRKLSHLCGFVEKAGLPLEELGGDIYNPRLWEVSEAFIEERMESLLANCMECELVGICAGGCILSGLDSSNKLNKAACAYQKEMWKIYVEKAYNDIKRV